jgi:hypothetical protein
LPRLRCRVLREYSNACIGIFFAVNTARAHGVPPTRHR